MHQSVQRAAFWLLALAPVCLADTLHVTDDAFVNGQQPTVNFGADQNVIVNRTRTALLRFDTLLASNTSGSTWLRIYPTAVQTPGAVTLHAILGPWSEDTVTAGTAPPINPQPLATIVFAASQVGDFVSIDVSSILQSWASGVLPNNGIALRANALDNTSVTFDAKENRRTSHGPELEHVPAADVLPKGTIVLWSGPLTGIPEGWALCDGQFPTPDMLGRFAMSIPDAFTNPGLIGGSQTHTHSGGSLSAPNHTHDYSGVTSDGSNDIEQCDSGDPQIPSKASHTHTYSGTTTPGGGGSLSGTVEPSGNLPPYFQIAFIMKL